MAIIIRVARSREGALIAVIAMDTFAGVLVGERFLHKTTMATVQRITGGLLLLISELLRLGAI